MADLAEQNHEITVSLVRHSMRSGKHEYVIEIYENGNLIIGGVSIESKNELTYTDLSKRALKQYYFPRFAEVTSGE